MESRTETQTQNDKREQDDKRERERREQRPSTRPDGTPSSEPSLAERQGIAPLSDEDKARRSPVVEGYVGTPEQARRNKEAQERALRAVAVSQIYDEHRDTFAYLKQPLGYLNHDRRLSRSSDREVADADHGHGQPPLYKPAALIPIGAEPDAERVRKRRPRKPPRRSLSGSEHRVVIVLP